MEDYGLKISKVGKSISSNNIDDLIFVSSSSVQATAMIVKPPASGTVTIAASSYGDVSITHDLGYIPTAILYTEPTPGSGNWYMGCAFTNTVEDTAVTANGAYTYVDDTYFKFRIYNSIASQKVIPYYYFILGESGI